MPGLLDKAVGSLKRKGFSESSAFAIGTSSLQKAGLLKKGTQKLTAKGKARSTMRRG